MRPAAPVLTLCCVFALSLAGAGVAAADVFGPIELVSSRPVQLATGSSDEQAENAEEAVIAGEGQYVAFVGSFGGVRGIWRRDLETGAVEQVAPGKAKLPSISANGSLVSFTTDERLAPEDDRNGAPDVYVRDMDDPCQIDGGACLPCGEVQDASEQENCPFAVVSAIDGTGEAATYTYTGSLQNEEESFGSLAAGRSAMSASGEYVVFETQAESNLLGGPTPAYEILVRNLVTKETSLVSSEYDPQTNTDTGAPVPDVLGEAQEPIGAAYRPPEDFGHHDDYGGASISADGTTVTWLGQDIGRQARLMPGEQAEYPPVFNEPLWRRIDEGPSAPTRRVTGGPDPENPLCAASGESVLPAQPNPLDPCQGPFALYNREKKDFVLSVSGANFVPQISADGDRVAFLASAPEVGSGQQFSNNETSTDLFVSEMAGSLPRVQALHRLTETGTDVSDIEQSASVIDLAISPAGNQVAFTTRRTQFPLGSPAYVSPVEPRAGIQELFDADLANDTLTRVTHGYAGEVAPSEQAGQTESTSGASSPSFADGENRLSFVSTADNLVYGDGNGASNAYLVKRSVFPNLTPQQYVSSPPAPPAFAPEWKLYAVARPQADGAVVLDVSVPGAGALSATAGATVPVTLAATHGAGARAGAHRAAGARTALLSRTVASARSAVTAAANGLQQLTLTPVPSYRSLARRSGGLYAAIALTFSAPGHPALHLRMHVTFLRTTGTRSAHSADSPRRRRKGRR